MKEFAIYSLLRLMLLAAVFVVVLGIWILVFGNDSSIVWPLLLAFLVSGILSVFLLNRPREAFAERVEGRAHRVASRYHELRSKEDRDESAASEPGPGTPES